MDHRFRKAALAVVAVVGLVFTASEVLSAPPSLSRLYPAGGQRGTKVVTTCTGDFSWPIMVWAPGVEVVCGEDEGKLEVSIPPDLPADRVWVRLYNAEGNSNLVPFLIGSFQEIEEHEPNNSLSDAQKIEEPSVTVNGVLKEAGDVDGFAVSLEAGQTLVASLDANSRLGSPMDAVIQVVSADGFVLAENHDDVGLDPRFSYTATSSGKHVVRLFAFPSSPGTQIGFAGGDDYIYRLTLTTGPYITHGIPLSVSHTDPGAVEVFGWNIPPNTKLPVIPFGGTMLGDHREFEVTGAMRNSPDAVVGLAFSPQFGGAARIRLAPHAIASTIVQTESDNPMTLVPPIAITGWLRLPRKEGSFLVPLKKDQQAVIAVESYSLYLPLIPAVTLTDPAGATAAKVEISENGRDAVIAHTATQDGDYRLTVRDVYQHGGDRFIYRLTVRLEQPDFEMSASADSIVVAVDKPTEFPVTINRYDAPPDGSIGPITIEAVGLPAGVTAPAVQSEPTGDTAGKVTLVFSTTGEAYSGPIRILGTASSAIQLKRFARTPARLAVSHETIWLTAVAKP